MSDPWVLINAGLRFVFVTWTIALDPCRLLIVADNSVVEKYTA
jgi:hypothetical protein